MKLLRYGEPGRERPGMLDDAGDIRDLGGEIADLSPETVTMETLDQLRMIDPESLPKVEGDPRMGSCVTRPGKFICVGLNYSDHAEESGMPVPETPVLFMKATSALCGPNDPIIIPRGATKTDWEVELGIVIGRHAKYVDEADALDYVAGLCVINDVSEREFQLEGTGQWVKGKSCDNFGPTGPWLVTLDDVSDPHNLAMWLEVNGHRYQDGSTRTMIFNVPYLVSFISQYMSMQPGDIISTGTPPGVGLGQKPPTYLKVGDRVSLGIEGLGEQHQLCIADN
jgi:2-keto-4-pentenoate hydratase/2-oxohepta-3-ene-1,7-dioic acid hydratase in catechol pathway